MSNPLDGIMAWYDVAYDAMRVTRRVLDKGAAGVVTDRHVFYELPEQESRERIENSIVELQNVVVLALVAAFERTLRECILGVVDGVWLDRDPFHAQLREELKCDVEHWHFAERLIDAFPSVAADDRGLVKQLVRFRDWVAHGHFQKRAAPHQAEPRTAYERLTAFLRTAGIIP